MNTTTFGLSEALREYLLSVSLREPEVLRRLRAETAPREDSNMQIAPEQGTLMSLLIELIGARHTLDIGVFTGYSALAVALALPDDGRVIACDLNEDYTTIARRYWAEAGVAGKIDLRLAPALDTLDALLSEGAAGSFDFAFIDADKLNYMNYYERCLQLLRPGGLIAVDNVLWSGSVIDASNMDDLTEAIRAFNAKLAGDERVSLCMLPIGDGLTLAMRRA